MTLTGPSWTLGARLPGNGNAGCHDAADAPGARVLVRGPLHCLDALVQWREFVAMHAHHTGPGHYDAVEPACQGPAWTIAGKQAGAAAAADATPGPGHYGSDAGSWDQQGPAFSITGRHVQGATGTDAATPGPGAATANAALHHMQGTSSVRTHSQHAVLLPAVRAGAYLPVQHVAASAPAYSMVGRPATQPHDSSLGPGAYESAALPRGPAFSIAGRCSVAGAASQLASSPGPGTYNAVSAAAAVAPAAPSWTLGAKLAQPHSSDAVDDPGPTDYQSGAGATGASAPAWTMPQGSRDSGAAAGLAAAGLQAGPGEYWPANTQHRPAFTIGGRWVTRSDAEEQGIGPGAYDLPAGALGGRWQMQAGKQLQACCRWHTLVLLTPHVLLPPQLIMPAPANTHTYTALAGAAFTMRSHCTPAAGTAHAAAAALPSPGDYHASVRAGAGSPAFSLGGRPAAIAGQDGAGVLLPGPGAYWAPQPAGSTLPAFSLARRLAPTAALCDGPAPCDYHRDAAPARCASQGAYACAWCVAPHHVKKLWLQPPRILHYAACRPRSPAHTVAGRQQPCRQQPCKHAVFMAPGPGDYSTCLVAASLPVHKAAGKAEQSKSRPPCDQQHFAANGTCAPMRSTMTVHAKLSPTAPPAAADMHAARGLRCWRACLLWQVLAGAAPLLHAQQLTRRAARRCWRSCERGWRSCWRSSARASLGRTRWMQFGRPAAAVLLAAASSLLAAAAAARAQSRHRHAPRGRRRRVRVTPTPAARSSSRQPVASPQAPHGASAGLTGDGLLTGVAHCWGTARSILTGAVIALTGPARGNKSDWQPLAKRTAPLTCVKEGNNVQ